jgi:hypothetical protein
MKIAEFKIVLNRNYGGFSITEEMFDWLVQNKGWKDYPAYGDDEVRRNPDLIECVRAVQKAHENDSWSEQRYNQIFALRIFDVTVNLEIEDVHDGMEEARAWTTVEPEEEED